MFPLVAVSAVQESHLLLLLSLLQYKEMNKLLSIPSLLVRPIQWVSENGHSHEPALNGRDTLEKLFMCFRHPMAFISVL